MNIAALTKADSVALDDMDVSDPKLYQDDVWWPYFARLRREAPVHYCRQSLYGPYWSVTRYKDIMQVEVNHQVYSSASELGGIAVEDQPKDLERPSFIRMDPPKHDEQRMAVSPVVAPVNLANMEGLIRERTARVLDGLPRGEVFDWVDLVSIELTTMMLATLFDYPWERPAPADLLVRRRDRQCPLARRAGAFGGGEIRRADQDGPVARQAVRRAGAAAAQIRPAVDAGAWRGDAQHAVPRVHGHAVAADRRRQRHDAQFDDRRLDGAERASAANTRSCATIPR